MEGVCINPVWVIGPMISTWNLDANSIPLSLYYAILMQLKGLFPNSMIGIFVDVRDVSTAHINAMLKPKHIVNYKRYLIAKTTCTYQGISNILYNKYGTQYGTTINPISSKLILLATYLIPKLKDIQRQIGRNILFDNTPSITELDVKYTKFNKTVIDSAECLIQLGVIKKKSRHTKIIMTSILAICSSIIGVKYYVQFSKTLKSRQ